MITNPKIEVGDAEYSKLSHVLRFTVASNHNAIKMVEDICGRTDMSMDEIVSFFQELIDSGLCWTLQGHYGRMAKNLIEDGLCNEPG